METPARPGRCDTGAMVRLRGLVHLPHTAPPGGAPSGLAAVLAGAECAVLPHGPAAAGDWDDALRRVERAG